ncbi:MAG: hypothetical protein LBI30_02355 [Holosporales bacterium]|nr:hypothetical protein [Holosporales bacterium]
MKFYKSVCLMFAAAMSSTPSVQANIFSDFWHKVKSYFCNEEKVILEKIEQRELEAKNEIEKLESKAETCPAQETEDDSVEQQSAKQKEAENEAREAESGNNASEEHHPEANQSGE